MHPNLHHTVVLSRLAELRRASERGRHAFRARPAPPGRRPRRGVPRLRLRVRPAA